MGGRWFAHAKVKERRLCGGGGNMGVPGEGKQGHRELGMIFPINVNHQIVLSNRKEGPYQLGAVEPPVLRRCSPVVPSL